MGRLKTERLYFNNVEGCDMARREKVSFLAKKEIKKRVTFEARGKKVSFIARVPSKRRTRVTFYAKKKGETE